MMFLGVLLNLLIFGLFIFAVKKIFTGGKSKKSKGSEVRRFFQYGLLFTLMIISGIGVSGLLGRLLNIGIIIRSDRGPLALEASFVFVGVPLLLVMALWTRNTFRKDSNEGDSVGWNLYLTAASIISLILNLIAQLNIYKVVLGDGALRGKDISQFVIWGAVWFVHFKMHKRNRRKDNAISDHLVGSLIGLGFCFVGLITILEGLIRVAFSMGENPMLFNSNNDLVDGIITLAVGAPVWYLYWIRTAAKATKESIWYGYVLLIGVGASLLTSVIAAAFTFYSILVWFFGDTKNETAFQFFNDAPASTAATFVGLLLVWYHRDVLANAQTQGRTEIRRIYEYVIAGIGLVSTALGVTMVFVSIIESIFKSTQLTGTSSINSLLAAITLIVVGAPVWSFMWKAIEKQIGIDAQAEQSSLVRRIYLFLLFGVSGVTSVITLLTATYTAFNDLFKGQIGTRTIRSDRFAISLLITTMFVSIYHWQIYKKERHIEVKREIEEVPTERLYFFVKMEIKPRSLVKLLDALKLYAIKVRQEDGCEQFDVLVDGQTKNTIFIYEIWTDSMSHAGHLQSDGFEQWHAFSEPLITNLEINNLVAK